MALDSRLFVQLLVVALATCMQLCVAKAAEEDVIPPKRSEEDLQFIKDSGLDPDAVSPDAVFIRPPSYTDEEQLAVGMPRVYQCDGCKILAYQLRVRFSAAEKKKGSSKKSLQESEIIDIVEGLCKDNFEDYALLSTTSGTKYLVGDGLDNPRDSGSMDNGPLWSKRLRRMCLEILDTYDEDEIYEMYKSSKTTWNGDRLCSVYCPTEKNRKSEL